MLSVINDLPTLSIEVPSLSGQLEWTVEDWSKKQISLGEAIREITLFPAYRNLAIAVLELASNVVLPVPVNLTALFGFDSEDSKDQESDEDPVEPEVLREIEEVFLGSRATQRTPKGILIDFREQLIFLLKKADDARRRVTLTHWLMFVQILLMVWSPQQLSRTEIRRVANEFCQEAGKRAASAIDTGALSAEDINKYRIVSVEVLNIRQHPAKNSPRVGQLTLGTVVRVERTAKGRNWSLIEWYVPNSEAQLRGWVFSRYLRKIDLGKAREGSHVEDKELPASDRRKPWPWEIRIN